MHLFMEQPDCEVTALCDVYIALRNTDFSYFYERYVKDMKKRFPEWVRSS